jgi:hypothetical protein
MSISKAFSIETFSMPQTVFQDSHLEQTYARHGTFEAKVACCTLARRKKDPGIQESSSAASKHLLGTSPALNGLLLG